MRTCHWLDFQRHPTLVITSPQRRPVTDQRAAGAFSVTVCSLPVTGQRAGGGVVSHSVFTACYRSTSWLGRCQSRCVHCLLQINGLAGALSVTVFTACYRSTGWRGRCQSQCVHCLLQINGLVGAFSVTVCVHCLLQVNGLAGALSVTVCSLPVTDQRSGGGVVSHAVFTACHRSTIWRGCCQSRCVHCLLQINGLARVLSVTMCSLPVTDQRAGGGVPQLQVPPLLGAGGGPAQRRTQPGVHRQVQRHGGTGHRRAQPHPLSVLRRPPPQLVTRGACSHFAKLAVAAGEVAVCMVCSVPRGVLPFAHTVSHITASRYGLIARFSKYCSVWTVSNCPV